MSHGPSEESPQGDPATIDEVLAAVESTPPGDLGRDHPEAEPVVYDALANLMALVRRECGE